MGGVGEINLEQRWLGLSRSVSDSGQVWTHCLDFLCLCFPISESTTQVYSCSLTLCWGLTFCSIQDPPAVPCCPWAAEAGEDLINLGVGVDLHSLVQLSDRDWQQHR